MKKIFAALSAVLLPVIAAEAAPAAQTYPGRQQLLPNTPAQMNTAQRSVHRDAQGRLAGTTQKVGKQMVYRDGKGRYAGPIEFGIISALCKNAGKVVTTQELFEAVWGEKYLDSSNTVMVHIRRIREKMNEKPKNPKFIKTVWGVGYKIEKDI